MSKNIKVEVTFQVKRTIELDPADYIDDMPEFFDEEGQLADEQELIDYYQDELESNDEARDESISAANSSEIEARVSKV